MSLQQHIPFPCLKGKVEPILFHLFALLVLAAGCLIGILSFNQMMDRRLASLYDLQDHYRTICDVSLIINRNVARMQVSFQSMLLASSSGELKHAEEQITESMETVRRAALFLERGGRFIEDFKVNFDDLEHVVHAFRMDTTKPGLKIASLELRTSLSLLDQMLNEYHTFALVRMGQGGQENTSAQLILMHKQLSPFFSRFMEHANRFYVQSMKNLTTNQAELAYQKQYHLQTMYAVSGGTLLALTLIGWLVARSAAQILTKRHQTEEELRKLSLAVEQSPASVVITDMHGNIEYVNAKFSAITGYALEEVVGKNPSMLQSGETSRETYRSLWREVSAGKEWQGEFQNKKKDGELYWEVATISPIRNTEGAITHYLAVKEDITRRKQVEEELRRHDALLRAVSQAIHVLLSEKDLDAAMPVALELLGQATGQDRAYLFELHPDPASGEQRMSQRYEWVREGVSAQIDNPDLQNFSLEQILPRWDALLRRGATVAGPVRSLPESEQPFFLEQEIVSLMVVPVEVEGQFWGTIGFDNCHTEYAWGDSEQATLTSLAASVGAAVMRYRSEEALRESNARLELASSISRGLAQQAEAANKAKGLFLANMSHEIRTPMNAIIGMTHLAMRAKTEDQRRRFLDTVRHSAESLLGLLNDILDFSKMEAGQLRLTPVPFDLHRLLQGIVSTMNVPAVEKGLHLTVHSDEGLPAVLIGDDLRLRQILLNLVGNAIKFTRSGTVALTVTGENGADGNWTLHFVVTDTGIGIPPEKCALIFTSFEQADTSHARQFGGTGLGLSICSQLVSLMQGKIWVESRMDAGSAFHFTIVLPVGAEQPVKSFEHDQDRHPAIIGLQILVVDDNEVNRDVASMTLDRDHRVTTAGNGLEALTMLAAERYDVVLMDVQMPEMDGLTATAVIRALEQGMPSPKRLPAELARALGSRLRGGHVPIVAMTAHAMGEDRELCLAAGMDNYITKPFQPAQLAEMLHALMPTSSSAENGNGDDKDAPTLAQVTAHLQQATGFNPAQIERVLAAVRQTLADNLALAREAAALPDPASLARAAHTLKGTLVQCGLHDLAEQAEALHRVARTGTDLSCGSSLLEQLRERLAGLIEQEQDTL